MLEYSLKHTITDIESSIYNHAQPRPTKTREREREVLADRPKRRRRNNGNDNNNDHLADQGIHAAKEPLVVEDFPPANPILEGLAHNFPLNRTTLLALPSDFENVNQGTLVIP